MKKKYVVLSLKALREKLRKEAELKEAKNLMIAEQVMSEQALAAGSCALPTGRGPLAPGGFKLREVKLSSLRSGLGIDHQDAQHRSTVRSTVNSKGNKKTGPASRASDLHEPEDRGLKAFRNLSESWARWCGGAIVKGQDFFGRAKVFCSLARQFYKHLSRYEQVMITSGALLMALTVFAIVWHQLLILCLALLFMQIGYSLVLLGIKGVPAIRKLRRDLEQIEGQVVFQGVVQRRKGMPLNSEASPNLGQQPGGSRTNLGTGGFAGSGSELSSEEVKNKLLDPNGVIMGDKKIIFH